MRVRSSSQPETDPAIEPIVAVILPCHNEGSTIAQVVRDFRRHLPNAAIYVYDNNSTDQTAAEAEREGAIVRRESAQGKGHAVRRAFAQVEAEVWVLTDGDGTYDAASAVELVRLLCADQLDMVVGVRREVTQEAYRTGHNFGNKLFNLVVRWLFGAGFRDTFSGYRAVSRPFVKSFPSLAGGFEIETEMSVHALQLGLPTAEVVTAYNKRVEGSQSKLRTYRDGALIFVAILQLLWHHRPFMVCSVIAAMAALASVALGVPVVVEFFETGLVPRFPTAILASSLAVIAVISFVTGIILNGMARAAMEQKRLFYLSVPRRLQSHGP